jgi:phosphoribosylanthranilate isomerase
MSGRLSISMCDEPELKSAESCGQRMRCWPHAGADAIGMVFYPSAKRCISVEHAKEILAVLPPFVTPVGLFVDSSADDIRDIARELHLRHLQLHGNESPAKVAELREFSIIKAIRVDSNFGNELSTWSKAIPTLRLPHLRGLVLETGGTKQAGGTGIENDWDLIRKHQDDGNFSGLPPLIAAGGLNPQNVTKVVEMLRPWAVDVSSGVEELFGVKSKSKIAAFTEAVHLADTKRAS